MTDEQLNSSAPVTNLKDIATQQLEILLTKTRLSAASYAIDLFIEKIESDKDYGFPSDILLTNKDYVMDFFDGEKKNE